MASSSNNQNPPRASLIKVSIATLCTPVPAAIVLSCLWCMTGYVMYEDVFEYVGSDKCDVRSMEQFECDLLPRDTIQHDDVQSPDISG